MNTPQFNERALEVAAFGAALFAITLRGSPLSIEKRVAEARDTAVAFVQNAKEIGGEA